MLRSFRTIPVPSTVFGKPDFIFRKERLAVFIDGCFWHGCPKPKHSPMLKNNAEFWLKKLTKNKECDATVTATLQERGWRVVRIWECDLARKNWGAVAGRWRIRGKGNWATELRMVACFGNCGVGSFLGKLSLEEVVLGMSKSPFSDVVISDPEVMGGTPVFVGTRVPLQNLIDSLEGGESLEDFLDGFPTVQRQQALAVIQAGKGRILETLTAV